jgi:hypothetical protein
VQGRFTSPDEFTGGPDELFDFAEAASDNPTFYADLDDPQSLNKYQYCYNNPLGFTDLDGHKPSWLNWNNAQRALDVASLVPGLGTVASLANAGISLARGDRKGAVLNALGAIPGGAILKTAVVAGTAVVAAVKVARVVDKVNDARGVAKIRQFNLPSGPHVTVEVVHKL